MRWAVLESLARDKTPSVGRGVAGNPSAPVELLLVMARSSRDDVRVAAHPDTSGEVLADLAGSRDPKVRVAVARSRRTPLEALRALSLDAEASVRKAVHGNKSATDEIRAQAALLGV